MKRQILLRLSCLFFSVFGCPSVATAKDLYLTVRRDFSTSEQPVIETNYRSDSPIQVRLLQPVDLKEFIASQLDLRRAWRQPKLEDNAAAYLLRGLNASRLGLDWLRRGASESLRNELQSSLGGGEMKREGTRLHEGPARLISTPDQFKVVSEYTIYPEPKDKGLPFDVPGFETWFTREGGTLKTRAISFPPQKPGFYLAQVIQGTLEGQVVVVVNDLFGQLQQSEGRAVVRVADRDGQAVSGARVSIRNLRGKWVGNAQTPSDGVADFPGLADRELIVAIESAGKGTAIIDSDFYSSVAVFPDLYLYTDRPMYKPGDKVRFRGILRDAMAKQAWVSLVDQDGAALEGETAFPTTSFGTFSGELSLKSERNGVFRVVARPDSGEGKHAGEFRVKEYVKPPFFVKIDSDQESLKAGETLRARSQVSLYAGGVPKDAKVRADLFRVRLETPEWIEDAGMTETGSAVTYGGESTSQSSISAPLVIASRDDIPVDAQGFSDIRLDLPQVLPGEANYEYTFLLKVSATDNDANSAGSSKNFHDQASEMMLQARFNAVLADETFEAKLKIRSVTPSGKPYADAAGKLEWWLRPYQGVARKISESRITTGAQGSIEITAPRTGSGELSARIMLKDRKGHESYAEVFVLMIAKDASQGVVETEQARIVARKSDFKVGEVAKALLLLPEGWGAGGKNRGTVHLTIAGRKIHHLRTLPVHGVSAWIDLPIEARYGTGVHVLVSYADRRLGWQERKISYRIPPAEKLLGVKLTNAQETVMPGGEQTLNVLVKDSAGQPVQAELSVSVVDRAVLDLQPEFRPSLLEFFYPPEKLNLMTFVSSEFQGYGYGEPLANRFKPNYRFASTKSDLDELKEEDTAFWTGTLKTDAQGRGSVRFRMPGNQTIWRVSAVATDVQGRMGEGSSEFRSKMPIALRIGMPAFLRENDVAQIRVNVGHGGQDKQTYTANYALSSSPAVELSSPIDFREKINPGQGVSRTSQLKLVAKGRRANDPREEVHLKSSLKLDDRPSIEFAHPIRALSDRVSQPETISGDRGKFVVRLSARESVSSARLSVLDGLGGAIVPALEWLLTYPYGCVEQLVSTTMPHLVMAQVLAAARINIDRLPPRHVKVLTQARETARIGLQKLAKFQSNYGGFQWFTGSSYGDDAQMTGLVLLTLLSADDPMIFEEGPDLVRATSYLRNGVYGNESTLHGLFLSFAEARLLRRGKGQIAVDELRSRLKLQSDWANREGSLMEKSLALFAVVSARLHKDPDFTKLVQSITGALAQALRNPPVEGAHWTPDEYLGRRVSTAALMVRALSEAGALDADLRQRATELLARSFNGEHFGSTWETAEALIQGAPLLTAELLNRARGKPPQIGGADASLVATLGGWEAMLSPRSFASGKTTEISVDGVHPSAITRLRIRRETPYQDVQATRAGSGWGIQRKIFHLNEKNGQREELSRPLKVGDLVFVSLALQEKLTREFRDARYFLVTEDVPAGWIPIDEDRSYESAPFSLPIRSAAFKMREFAGSQIRWFFDFKRGWMEKGNEVGYVARVAFAGEFESGIARVEDFYDETRYAQTASRRFKIEPQTSGP